MRTLRLLTLGWLFRFKELARSSFNGILGLLYPLFFATVAFFVFRAGDSPRTLVYASLGAAVMGMWSATSTTAGAANSRRASSTRKNARTAPSATPGRRQASA